MSRQLPCFRCSRMVGVTDFCADADCPVYAAYEYAPPEAEVSTSPVEMRGKMPVLPEDEWIPPAEEVSTTPVKVSKDTPAVALTLKVFDA